LLPNLKSLRVQREGLSGEGELSVVPSSDKTLGELFPENPFLTSEYLLARRPLCEEVFFLLLIRKEGAVGGFPCIIKTGLRGRTCEIPSFGFKHSVSEASGKRITEFFRSLSVSNVQIGSFAAVNGEFPNIGRMTYTRPRREVIVRPAVLGNMPESHRRNIRKAERAGLTVATSKSEALNDHFSLVSSALSRKELEFTGLAMTEIKICQSLLEQGAADIVQAHLNEDLVGSVFLIHSQRGAYYHSSGTNELGRESGAAHLLVSSISARLREEGKLSFNLGGAGFEEEGLFRLRNEIFR
jgi:Acetyltransferase (GNAT) domain